MIDNSNKENENFILTIKDHAVYANVDWKKILDYSKKRISSESYDILERKVDHCLSKAAMLFDMIKLNKPRFQELVKKRSDNPKTFLTEIEKDIDEVTGQYIDFYQFKKDITDNYQQYGKQFKAAFDIIFTRCILYIEKSVRKKSVHFSEDSQLDSICKIPKEGAGKPIIRKGIGFFPKLESQKRRFSGAEEAEERSRKKILKSSEASVEKPPKATNLN